MKTYKLENLEINEEQIRKLIKENPELLEKKGGKPWRAEENGVYFYLASDGQIESSSELSFGMDDYRYLIGNYFSTKEEAVAYKARQEAIGRVTHAILEANDGWEPNWADISECKWFLNYELVDTGVEAECLWTTNSQPIIPHMASGEIAKQILKDHEADLKLIFNVK